MRVYFTKPAIKQFKKFPIKLKNKTLKKIKLLSEDINHPSLYFRKKGNSDQYECRIDIHYRFTGEFINEDFYITSVGMHDVGLGKK